MKQENQFKADLFKENLKKTLNFFKPLFSDLGLKIWMILAAMALVSASSTIMIWLNGHQVDLLTNVRENINEEIIMIIIIFVFYSSKKIFSSLLDYAFSMQMRKSWVKFQLALIADILLGRVEMYADKGSEDIRNRVSSGSEIRNAIRWIPQGLSSIICGIVAMVWSTSASLVFLIINVLDIAFNWWIVLKTEPKNIKIGNRHADWSSKKGGIIKDALEQFFDIHLQGTEKSVMNRIRWAAKLDLKGADLECTLEKKFRIICGIENSIVLVLFYILGIYLVYTGELSIGFYTMIILSRGYVDDASDAIQSFIAWTLPKLTVAAERIDALRAYGKQEYGWCNLESDAIHHIEIKNLKYSYNNEGTDEKTLVLDGVSMSLFVGKTYAIVGRSGSGKTTLAKCLTRLHELQEGKILINGRIEMKEIDRDTLPRIIGMVSQRSNVFNGTIRDQFSDLPNYSYERMVEALKIVGLWDDIISKPKGVDTKIGEKGMKLSGGQVQRLAIAIVLMQDPKILIMDEATSAQDSATQAEIYNNLRKSGWLKRKIVIIIAHRLSTISNADEIFVLGDEGKLVGSGNHTSLLETCDYYKKLVKEEKGNL